MARLGGKGIKNPKRRPQKELCVYHLDSMDQAIAHYRAAFRHHARFRENWRKEPEYRRVPERMLGGSRLALESIMAKAEELINEAVLEDPRLVRKAGWVLDEDGMDGCPALIAQGEERAFLNRRRKALAQAATTEPVRIVISTDSRHVSKANAAAFVAAAKLAQQFRPLEIWWQGAWLREKDTDIGDKRGTGHVFLVPLIQGDMDFSRLQFVLSDPERDMASFYIMVNHAWPQGYGWDGGVAAGSFLEATHDFVKETGIEPRAGYVAERAAYWAGLEPKYREAVHGWEAEQHWKPAEGKANTWAMTAEERRRMEREERERQRAKEEEARRRLGGID